MSDINKETLQRLLALQEVDLARATAEYQKKYLPEEATRKEVLARAARIRPELEAAAKQEAKGEAQLQAIANDRQNAKDRLEKIEEKLYSSTSGISPEDAMHLSREAEHLKERMQLCDDKSTETRAAQEPVRGQLEALTAAAEVLRDELLRTSVAIDEANARINEELRLISTKREEILATIPAALQRIYEQESAGRNEPLVATVDGGICGACHLGLSSVERDRLRRAPETELVRCTECNAILVRQ